MASLLDSSMKEERAARRVLSWQVVTLGIALCLGSLDTTRPSSPSNAKVTSSAMFEISFRSDESAAGSWKPMVAARILDVDIDLMIDTGGESSALPKQFLQRFQEREETTITDSNGLRRAYGVGPTEIFLGKNRLGKYSFMIMGDYLNLTRGKEIWDANAPTVGMNVLENFRVRIDGVKGRMTLSDENGPTDGAGWVKYTGFNGTPHQTVQARTSDGEELRVFLDTGYARSRILKKFCGSHETPIQLLIGETRIDGFTPQILNGDADLRMTSPGKEEIVIHATLGWDVLRNYVLELSPRNKQLRLSKGD